MTTATLDKQLAVQKLKSAIALTDKLLAGDWPYEDSSDALKAIRSEFSQKYAMIEASDNASEDMIAPLCQECRSVVVRYLTFIGVIIRSSDIRNAFELYSPIRRMCTALLGEDCRIILGSEWAYSPFVYPIPAQSLERFVFFGLPASEAENSLLTPIAGHELGHAVWRQKKLLQVFAEKIQVGVVNRFESRGKDQHDLFGRELSREQIEKDLKFRQVWLRAFELTNRQCEEVFCDVLACWIFGESFAHAFRYLTYPDAGGRQSGFYPSNRARAGYIREAIERYHGQSIPLEQRYPTTNREPRDRDIEFADGTVAEVYPMILDTVDHLCKESNLKKPTAAGEQEARESLVKLRPVAPGVETSEIINAAWSIRVCIDTWDVPGVAATRKIEILNDLVLKSFEVNEFAQIPENKV